MPLRLIERMTTKSLALTIVLTALYVVMGFVKLSPIIGLQGQAITAGAILAPLIGWLLGPFIGAFSTAIGGAIGLFFGSFSYLGLVSGAGTAFCSGLIFKGHRFLAFLFYFMLLVLLTFYPIIGPAWLYPAYSWFQVIVLVVLASPIHSKATDGLRSERNHRILFAFFIATLVSTSVGQIAGTLAFEVTQMPDKNYFKGTWTSTALLYPIERLIIAAAATLVGIPLQRALRNAKLISSLRPEHSQQKNS